MNLKKLSEITGYSVSTLSKTFSNSREISEITKKAIIEKAKELGCYEKYNKSRYGKKVVAILCPETSSAFYTTMLTYLNRHLEQNNITTIMSVTDFSAKKEQELLSFYLSENIVDGIIDIDGKVKAKKYTSIPIVFLGGEKDNPFADTVRVDFSFGIYQAIKNFVDNGHTKIGFIGEMRTKDKLYCFENTMIKIGLEINPDFTYLSQNRFEQAGYEGMEKLYKSGELPTAILAGYDYIAMGIIDFMEKHNLKMPDDISIIGIDNVASSSYKQISLSSISANTEQCCDIVLDLLLKKINHPTFSLIQSISINSALISRSSVKNITK